MSLETRTGTTLAAATFALILALTLGVPAQASHIIGIKTTISDIDFNDNRVSIDVTILYSSGPASSSSSAYMGNYLAPAIDWGDGETSSYYQTLYGVTSAVFPGAPDAGVYRGSFSHTYDDAGSYTITANTTCCPVSDSADIVTGNLMTATYSYSSSSSSSSSVSTTTFLSNNTTVDFDPEDSGSSNTSDGTSRCGLGAELAVILPPMIFWRERRRRRATV
ncbi:MAG: hypothetical protein JRG92_07730 [Deltaproteobacteria bacterium]|nr:hypothetical protein [Deltaproteobacteria bacterium]MBW2383509.1 hypothetical protein [Deltaproteobacteria bacterium]